MAAPTDGQTRLEYMIWRTRQLLWSSANIGIGTVFGWGYGVGGELPASQIRLEPPLYEPGQWRLDLFVHELAQLRPTLGHCLVQRGQLGAAAVVRHLGLRWTRQPRLGGRARCESGGGGRA